MRDTPEWLAKAQATFRFHRTKLTTNDKWTLVLTAKALKRALGSVSEDIMIVRWLRTHESDILKCDNAKEAKEFIKARKKKLEMEEDF